MIQEKNTTSFEQCQSGGNLPAIFNYDTFGQLRVVIQNGEPEFVAKDVAEALGYTWNGSARIAHVPDEWKGVTSVVTPSGNQSMATLYEQGVYFFLGRSDKPKALPLQKLVAGEILPSIRKTGGYIAAKENDTDEEIMARALLVAQATLKRRDDRIKSLETVNKEMQPKALFADAVSASTSSILVGELAKIMRQNGIQTGQNRFFAWLRENGYLIKRKGTDYNIERGLTN